MARAYSHHYSGTTQPRSENPDRQFIQVRVVMPHVAKYGRNKVMTLTYGCTFPVSVGQDVLCPPTKLNPSWTRGSVVGLGAGSYRGPVKYVAPMGGVKHRRTAAPQQQPVLFEQG